MEFDENETILFLEPYRRARAKEVSKRVNQRANRAVWLTVRGRDGHGRGRISRSAANAHADENCQ